MTIKVSTTHQWWISIKEHSDASVFDISRVTNNTARLLRVSARNRSVLFYPAFKVIFSLPVSLYRRDLQQRDQFLALKVSRNHLQNSLNSAARNNNELAMFSRAQCILPPPLVFVRALQTVLLTKLKNFSAKLVFVSEKSCEGLSGPLQKSLSNCSLQIQQQV